MKLKLSISPCPNDTFMFDALVNRRIDTHGLEFDVTYLDIEQLNEGVIQGAVDISKISYAVLPQIHERYRVLDSGSALGFGNGPLLVCKDEFFVKTAVRQGAREICDGAHTTYVTEPIPSSNSASLPLSRVAVPGEHTTANLLMQRLFPELTDRQPVLFSEIAPAVARGEFDAGVLIHEGRFTYKELGLKLVADLGVEWNAFSDGLPLPLGAIVASRALPEDVRRTMDQVLRESIEYAFTHPRASRNYVKSYARELDDAVIDSHIALFVNENSLSLSPDAKRAIELLTGINVD